MAFIDELIRVTSAPPLLSPPVVHVAGPAVTRGRFRPVTAVVRRDGSGAVELSPSVRVGEPDAADRHGMRLHECCDVAEALRGSFGGEWRCVGGDVVYRPLAGTRVADLERAAVEAFATRGMRARVL